MAGKTVLIDETGNRHGKLTVIKRSKKVGNYGAVYWDCICDCGKTTSVMGYPLRTGKTKTCGHCRSDREKQINKLFLYYRAGAKKRDLGWRLTRKEFTLLIEQRCRYCGTDLSNKQRINGATLRYNGIDRLDSSKGYTLDNVAPCCKICNIAKQQASVDEFLFWVEKVYKYSVREIYNDK